MTTCTSENNPLLLSHDKCIEIVQEWKNSRQSAENKLDEFLKTLRLEAPMPLPTELDAIKSFENMMQLEHCQLVQEPTSQNIRWRTDTICAPQCIGLINVKNASNERLKAASNYFHWKDRLSTGDSGHDSLLEYWDKFQQGKLKRSMGGLLLRLKDTREMMEKRGLTLYVLYYALRYTTSMVTQFPPVVARAVYEYFQPKKILDFSAGWGDRLAAAMSTSTIEDCICIDPRPEACVKYKLQKKLYAKSLRKNRKKAIRLKVYPEAAEDVLPKLTSESVDFIFSSPCFFDKETYGALGEKKDIQKQAYIRYPIFEKWLENFMIPVLSECMRILQFDGHLAIHLCDIRPKQNKIKDRKNPYLPITKSVFDYMQTIKNAEYVGSIGARTAARNGGVCYDPILIWKKNHIDEMIID